MNTPLITVTICAYNCEKFIEQAMDCILAQTYTNFELIIADDGSKDKTKSIIEAYKQRDSRIKTYHNENNMGYLKTFNKLIALAKGEYITFQDADDISTPDRIEKLFGEFQKDNTIGVCGSNFIGIDEEGKETYRTNVVLTHEEIVSAMPEKYNFHGTAVMITKKAYDTIGGYNEFFDRMGSEDHYWLYLITEKFKMKNLPDHLYFYRYNPNSVMGDLTSNSKKLFSNEILKLLIDQRRRTGTDDLESGNEKILQEKLEQLTKPFEEDKGLFLYKIAKQRYYEGHKKQSIQTMLQAIFTRPFRLTYYRDLYYFIKN